MKAESHYVPWSIRKQVLERDEACFYCGKVPARIVGNRYPFDSWRAYDELGRAFHFDHKVPLAHGGETTLENVVLACERCNLHKGLKRRPGDVSDLQLRLPLDDIGWIEGSGQLRLCEKGETDMGRGYDALYDFIVNGRLDTPIIDFICGGNCEATEEDDACDNCCGSRIALAVADQVAEAGLKFMKGLIQEWKKVHRA